MMKYLLLFIALLASYAVTAQIPAPPATPIDGGLGILLAAGAAYGFKKIKDRKTK